MRTSTDTGGWQTQGSTSSISLAPAASGLAPGTLAPTPGSATPQPASASALAPAGVAERVIAPQIANALGSAQVNRAIEVRLDPPELGRIEVFLEIGEQGLRATLSAERPGTAELIRRHSAELTQQFQDAGFEDIDLSFSDQRQSGEQDWDETLGLAAHSAPLEGATPTDSTPTGPRRPPQQSGLDLRL